MVKALLRDYVALAQQAIGLSHNRTRRQVKGLRTQLTDESVAQQRVDVIAQTFDLPPATVRDWVEGYVRPTKPLPGADWDAIGSPSLSRRDQRTLDALMRALPQPLRVCVETGAARGMSAAIILTAIVPNGGQLHSIDLSSSPFSDRFGDAIPDELRSAWTLHLQDTELVLPVLLAELKTIDFFLHDSNHTVQHMAWEYEQAWPYICSGGCLASHDILATTAFEDFQRNHDGEIAGGGVIGNFGFWMKC